MLRSAATTATRVLSRSMASTAIRANDAVIVAVARTPIGAFGGALASQTAPQLGSAAIKKALERAGLTGDDVNEVILGHVLAANVGQNPARQAALGAGLPLSVICSSVNKVCASGTKAIMNAAASIELGHASVIVAGGMESMSSAPFYSPATRFGSRYGHAQLLDGIVRDGLSDAYDGSMMGNCAEACTTAHGIGRAEQDAYAARSYERARAAAASGALANEIFTYENKTKRGTVTLAADEEPNAMDLKKLPTLRTVFKPDGGAVTAGNASKINDGAAALVLVSGAFAKARKLTPLAVIRGYGDAELAPVKFTDTPALATAVALKRAGLSIGQVDFFEVNEAFAVVALCNAKLMGVSIDKFNVDGGAVALGHPIGASGARIVGALARVLGQRGGRYGVAAICNGGGGASAVVLERVTA